MGEDVTLDEFDAADGEDAVAGADESDASADGDVDGSASTAGRSGDVIPVLRVSPDGIECGDCGEVVTRTWRVDDADRCADCQSW